MNWSCSCPAWSALGRWRSWTRNSAPSMWKVGARRNVKRDLAAIFFVSGLFLQELQALVDIHKKDFDFFSSNIRWVIRFHDMFGAEDSRSQWWRHRGVEQKRHAVHLHPRTPSISSIYPLILRLGNKLYKIVTLQWRHTNSAHLLVIVYACRPNLHTSGDTVPLKGQCHQIRMALKQGSFKGLS